MANPGGGKLALLPVAQVGPMWGGGRQVEPVEQPQAAPTAAQTISHPQRKRAVLPPIGNRFPVQCGSCVCPLTVRPPDAAVQRLFLASRRARAIPRYIGDQSIWTHTGK